jgi:hypothetical protein
MKVRLRAAWAAAGALWAGQLAGVIASPNLMSPAADMLADTATACLTVTLIGWHLLDRAGLRPAVTRAEYEANRAEVEAFKRAADRIDRGVTERAAPLALVRKDAAN